ncbi:hypothetical protein M569_00161 [Genlisea aurea]|uniref:BZIP domain-containing protein n=1 Tax=Genlisea aurea TaxID=192259 RepID=S8D589_9LAMI|nr:hypothetical protein M569_00161 [Genlisea aurea]
MHNYEATVTQQHIPITNSDAYCHSHSPFYLRGGEDGGRTAGTHVADLGELDDQSSQGNGFHHHLDVLHVPNKSCGGNGVKPVLSSSLHLVGLGNSWGGSTEMGSAMAGQLFLQKEGILGFVGGGGGHGHGHGHGNGPLGNDNNWADSGVVADHSGQTETSTDTDDKNQFLGAHNRRLIAAAAYSPEPSKASIEDQKSLRRLAQNREAARKSRLRKKAYIQQLESSRQKLAQLEHELKRGRHQSSLLPTSGCPTNGVAVNAFDLEYARWLEEQQRLIHDLRSALNSNVTTDGELQHFVDSVMSHYENLFQLKRSAAKNDIFHILSGMWKSPAERCFIWLGGFRSSDILKILGNQIEPLSEQQLVGICNLQQSSQQAEDALTQGLEALQQSLMESLSSNAFGSSNSEYMEQMTIALSKLAALENFLHQVNIYEISISILP